MKRPSSRFSKPKVKKIDNEDWHNGADFEIHLYALSLQKAAKSLIQTLQPERTPETAWDICPVILLYRQALELYLKAVVGEGSHFLKPPTDHISLATTHSLRWLAQLVCQIIKAVAWQSEFTCEGISSLAEFSALIKEIDSLDAVSRATSFANVRGRKSAAQTFQKINGAQFARKLDALLELLDVTADALAAAWDQRQGASGWSDFVPAIIQ